jgi:hypothetical protein
MGDLKYAGHRAERHSVGKPTTKSRQCHDEHDRRPQRRCGPVGRNPVSHYPQVRRDRRPVPPAALWRARRRPAPGSPNASRRLASPLRRRAARPSAKPIIESAVTRPRNRSNHRLIICAATRLSPAMAAARNSTKPKANGRRPRPGSCIRTRSPTPRQPAR